MLTLDSCSTQDVDRLLGSRTSFSTTGRRTPFREANRTRTMNNGQRNGR